jgi:hypothetical protein
MTATIWVIFTAYLTHPADNYITGQFTNQQYCINALIKSSSPETKPDLRQCVRLEQAAVDDYVSHKQWMARR